MHALCARHTGSDGGKYENAFQAFAENENADIEKRDRRARIRPHRIGRALCSNRLPHQHRDDKERDRNDADAQNRLHLGLKRITEATWLLPISCFFLAAGC